MSVQLIKHDTLERLRDEVKAKDFKKFLVYKAKRYAFFRVQNFLNGGCPPMAEHMEIVEAYEKDIACFGGVKGFAILWDLHPKTSKVIRRDKSVWQAHEEFMQRAAVPLGLMENTIH